MTWKIERNGQTIELTAEECWDIYKCHLDEVRLADIEQMLKYMEEDEEYPPEVIAYMRARISDALDNYAEMLDNSDDWADNTRTVLRNIADDYEFEQSLRADGYEETPEEIW